MTKRGLLVSNDISDVVYSGSACFSDYGECVSREVRQLKRDVLEPRAERFLNRAYSDFLSLPQRYGERGWNGYAAEPLSSESYEYASLCLRNMPPTIPPPKMLVDSNGDVSFHWYKSRNDRLEITFSKRRICFAMIVAHGERRILSVSSQLAVVEQMQHAISWVAND